MRERNVMYLCGVFETNNIFLLVGNSDRVTNCDGDQGGLVIQVQPSVNHNKFSVEYKRKNRLSNKPSKERLFTGLIQSYSTFHRDGVRGFILKAE